MNMAKRLAQAKKKAKQIKSDYPDAKLQNRHDIAARDQGAKHYTHLNNLQKLLGEDGKPSRVAILKAGGNPCDSPMRSVDIGFTVS